MDTPGCEILAHPADVGIAFRAPDLAGAFETAAAGLARDIPAGAGRAGALALSDAELTAVLARGLGWAFDRGYALPTDLAHCEEAGSIPGADPALVSEHARKRGHDQFGTLGSGNHFVELQVVEELLDPALAAAFGLRPGRIAVMIHSGSRVLGHQVATDYLKRLGHPGSEFGSAGFIRARARCSRTAVSKGGAFWSSRSWQRGDRAR